MMQPASMPRIERAASGSKTTGTSHVATVRAELAQRAARGLLADGLRVVELVEEALGGPVVAAALLAALVLGDGDDAERLVRALVRGAEAAREHERGAARGAAERRALAVGDARVEVARGLLADLRGRDGLRGVDARRPSGS